MPSVNKSAPVDASQWSEESRRSLDYMPAPEFYQDIVFTCRKCGCRSVFTAEQQKREYEIKKAHTLQQHVLCHVCLGKRHALAAENSSFAERWVSDKAGFKKDLPAIERWIEVLKFLPTYGGGKDAARIRMLEKVLSNAGLRTAQEQTRAILAVIEKARRENGN